LTNIAAWRLYKSYHQADTDSTSLNIIDTNFGPSRYDQWTDEIRLASPSSGRLSYQFGLYYLMLHAQEHQIQGAAFEPFVGPLPAPFDYFAGGTIDQFDRNQNYAAFGEGQFKITDKLRFTAGGRVTHDNIWDRLAFAQLADAINPLNPTADDIRRFEKTNFSYRFGLDYDLAPDVLAYVTYARGYKAGLPTTPTEEPVGPETPKSGEVGLKSTFLDRRLRLNVAAFSTTIDNFQTQVQRGTSGFRALNAGELKSKGVEVEFTALPTTGLSLTGGVTYLDTKYVDLAGVPCYFAQPSGTSGTNVCLPNGTTDVSGNQLENASKWTATLTPRYEHPAFDQWNAFVQGDVYYRSSYYFTQTRDPEMRIGGYSTFGVSVGAETSDGKINVTAFVRNLSDKRIPSLIFADPLSAAYGDAAKGGNYWQNFSTSSFRTFGLSLNYRM
jgi:iron complex outermembrane receptor protein